MNILFGAFSVASTFVFSKFSVGSGYIFGMLSMVSEDLVLHVFVVSEDVVGTCSVALGFVFGTFGACRRPLLPGGDAACLPGLGAAAVAPAPQRRRQHPDVLHRGHGLELWLSDHFLTRSALGRLSVAARRGTLHSREACRSKI